MPIPEPGKTRKVLIRWSEEVSYESDVEIDLDDFRTAGYDDPENATQVESYLNDDETRWFEQCDTTEGFTSVDERSLDEVTLVASKEGAP